MSKHAIGTRVAGLSKLLVVVLVLSMAFASAHAREDIANGQSGDPNDGSDVVAGGGSDVMRDQTNSNSGTGRQTEMRVLLVPVLIGTVVTFKLVFITAVKDIVR